MKVFWLLGLLALCFSVFANGINNNASRPTFVNIGALFTFESTIGRVAKIALQTAVNDVNSNSSILHGTKLNLIMRNSNCSAFVGMMQAMQFMQSNIVALIGPQSSVAAHSVSYVASELQVPLVSFSATDPYISQREFPFFVRTTQSDLYQMTAIAEIVDHYGWTKVIAVFIDDEYGRNGVSALDDALAERRCKISEKVGIKPDSNISRSEIMDHLVKFMLLDSRVIILHVNPETGFMIFKVAKYLGMMGTGYVWLSTDWLSSVLDSSSPLPPEAMETLQGVIVLRQHTPNSDRKRALISRWRSLTNGSFGLNSYGFYAYDSVWLVAHALDAFLDRGGAVSFSNDPNLRFLDHSDLHLETMSVFDGGKLLLQNILQRNLVGVSGPLKFDSDRSLIHPAYDIINVIGTGYRQVGYWSNYSGLSTMSPEMLYQRPPNHSSASQRLYVVFWPGGTTEVPRGWVLPSNGKQLEVGVPIRVSFQEFVSQVRESNDMFKGFCIDVFTAAVKLLPYALPYRFVGYGDGHKNPNYSKLVDMVAEGNLDAAIGDIAIVTSRTKVVDFTQPYAASGLVVVASFKSSNTGAWAFLRPFTPLTWGIIVVFFIIIGVVVWILEHRINDEFRGSPQMQLITILWFSFSTLTFSHRQNTISSLARLLLIIWLFVVLILTSSYTASLTSILTVKQLSSPIKGVDSLRAGNGKIGYQVGSYAEQYLNKELNISESRLVALNSSEEYAEALQQGRIEAVVDERPYIELFLSSQCDFRVVGQEFTRSGWGFAFPRDSPLATDMSTAILKLSENGELQRIHDKWLTKSACNVDTAEIESSQLHLKSFAGLFLLSGLAFSIALCIHFVHICRRFHQASVTEIVSSGEGSSRLKRLRTLLSVIDEKKNPLEDKRKKRKTEGSSSDNEDEDHQRNVRRKPTNNEDEDHQRNVKRNPNDVSTCGSINISG